MSTPKHPSQLFLDQIEILKADYQKLSLKEFKAGAKELFVGRPRLKTISWSGSEEYNDEGGTSFSSTHEEARINGFEYGEDYDGEEDVEDLETLGDEGDKEAKQIVKSVRAFLSSFPHDEFYGC